jgi:hypothetical protein
MILPTTTTISTTTTTTLINGRVSAPGTGVWTEDESKRFRVAMDMFPDGPWSAIANHVGTRTVRQTMTHAQKCRQRLERHARGLKPAGRKRRNQDAQSKPPPAGTEPSLSGTFAVVELAQLGAPDKSEATSTEPSLSGTFAVVELAQLGAPDKSELPMDPSNFDWVLQYLNSPDWIDLELSDEDVQLLDLMEMEP